MTNLHNLTRNEEIVRRRQAGEWPSDIWRSMKVSKGAVLGVLFRAGMCGPETDRITPAAKHRPRGEDNGMSVLTTDAVLEIRRRYKRYSQAHGAGALSRKFGVRSEAIYDVVYGRTWKHIPMRQADGR